MMFSRRMSTGLLATLLLLVFAAQPAMSQDEPKEEKSASATSKTPQEQFPSKTIDTGEADMKEPEPGASDFISGSWMYILIGIVVVVAGGYLLMKGSPPAGDAAPAASDPAPAPAPEPASGETGGASDVTDSGDGGGGGDGGGIDDTLGGGSE